jgi:hypothetical protein
VLDGSGAGHAGPAVTLVVCASSGQAAGRCWLNGVVVWHKSISRRSRGSWLDLVTVILVAGNGALLYERMS